MSTIRSLVIGCAAFVLAVALPACGGDDAEESGTPAQPVVIRILEKQSGGSTALKIGHVLRIELSANPTTGYAWSLAAVDDAVLEPPAMEEYRPPDSDAMGAGGISVWEFKAVGAGATALELLYRPPGMAPDGSPLPPEKTFACQVIVD